MADLIRPGLHQLDGSGATDGDVATWSAGQNRWVPLAASASGTGWADPTTTLGDIVANNGSGLARVAVGADGKVLTADSAAPEGVSWQSVASSGSSGGASYLGDLLDVSTTGEADGDVLTYSAAASGWVPLASSGGASGALSGQRILLNSQVLASAAATVSFSASVIPSSGYTHLIIEWTARLDAAVGYSGFTIEFNGDSTASHYNRQRWTVASGSTSSAYSSGDSSCGLVGGTSGAANVPSSGRIDIREYLDTTFYKSVDATSQVLAVPRAQRDMVYWANTSAITSVDLLASTGNFVAGSIFRLYGIVS